MDTIEIRKDIHRFVDEADERLLKIIYAIIQAEESEEPSVPEFFYKELDERREKHKSGESKSFTWEEVQFNARNASK